MTEPHRSPLPPASGVAPTRPLDLTTCDREPVQFPGAIMPHGVMLLLNPADLRIRGLSANAPDWLGRGLADLCGGRLDGFLPADDGRRLADGLARIATPGPPRYLGSCRLPDGVARCDCFAHRSGAHLVLEFESIPAPERWPTERFAEVTAAIASLQPAATWQACMASAVRALKRLCGFASVQGVRFLADGSGLVVAEARDDGYPSYLDLRFPRADIPAPARRQLALMPVQYAPDLAYRPVPLLMADPGADALQIDLGQALLRSVSVMCNRFYLNMGTRARLVLTILDHGELWGFFACWHRTPRPVPYGDRLAYRTFADMAGFLLVEKQAAEQQRLTLEAKRRSAAIAADLNAPGEFALDRVPGRVLDSLGLGGAALCAEGRIGRAGTVPPEPLIRALLPWLDGQAATFATDRLPTLFAPAATHADTATGLLAARLLGPGQYLLGFRPEWVHEVRWAGDPRKPVELDLTTGEQRLTPRGSFAVWKEDVRGLARPWRAHETEALVDLQRALVLAQHADQQRRLQTLLERSNAELEAFAYVVSHDLQEPLRGIRNFSQFLYDRLDDRLAVQERGWLDTIMRLTVRMTDQIGALLQYSRAGQQPLAVRRVEVGALLRSVLDALAVRIAEAGARVEIATGMPSLMCDPIRTAAIFENLIANGLKYNDQADKRIEVGFRAGQAPTFFVRDNGIGIAERHREAIFTIFRRLHGRDDYGGGTGAGLTIARKHVERQGGRLWLESVPGRGSTFFFTLDPERDGAPTAR